MTNEEWALADYYDNLEQEWKNQQPKYSDMGWIEIFPEAKPIVVRQSRLWITEIKKQQDQIFKDSRELKNKLSRTPATEHSHIEFSLGLLQEQFDKLGKELMKKQWLLDRLNNKPEKEGSIGPAEIQRAKDTPISQFVEGKRKGKLIVASCPWHSDSTPSFTIYENNTFHCFSCGTGSDVIDFIMKLHTMTFLEAVKWLINK